MKTISIGRDDQCNIVIIDKTSVVSRRHAVIMIDSYGKMTITDYSSNGTYINGIKISHNVAVPITRKDTVSFAHVADLDWRLVPDVRGKLIKLFSVIGVCVVAIGITLGIVLGKEDPINPDPIPPTPIVDTTSRNIQKPDAGYHAKQDTVKPEVTKEEKQDENDKPAAKEEQKHPDKKHDGGAKPESEDDNVQPDPILI